MSLKILVDMNLSTEWVDVVITDGWEAAHWSTTGDPRANDTVIMAWALANGFLVFTHDLDFGNALALTCATGPSVVQLRGPMVLPEKVGASVLAAMHKYEVELAKGALVVVDPGRSRVRVLPTQKA